MYETSDKERMENLQMKLDEYTFGYADAAKELLLEPSIFSTAFSDSKNILSKLKTTWKYMLIGRKGVGKSAYSSKLQYLSSTTNELITYPIPLNDFEYSTFAKTSSDNNTVGTKKYLESWNFLILLTIYKILFNEQGITEINTFSEMILKLEKLGFLVNDDFKNNVTKISKLKLGANIGIFDAAYETEFGIKPISFTERIATLTQKMKEILLDIYLDKKIYILIDGVDDILRFKKHQLEILGSLIRSIDSLNEYFFKEKVLIKIILFIREDIINTITDPDLNKIKRDGALPLSWVENTDDLKEIIELRFHMNYPNDSSEIWYKLFPRQIRDTDSWDFLLEHTLYKPRDILQFLSICQELYPNNETLSRSEMLSAIKTYSRDYFLEEMKNELSGFSDDSLINTLPSILQKVGSKFFYWGDFLKISNEQSTSKIYTEQDIKYLLLLLFQAGYIGQLVKNNRGKESVVFKYRNPSSSIDYSQKFISHRGLQKGLGIIL